VAFGRPRLEHRGLDHHGTFGRGQRPAQLGREPVQGRVRVRADLLGPFRPQADQLGRHTGDLGLPVRVDRREHHPQPLGQLGAQRRLVQHAGSLLVVVDLVSIDGPPPPVGAAQLVHHQRVGMQLRITRRGHLRQP
jgi:hypothetical protein